MLNFLADFYYFLFGRKQFRKFNMIFYYLSARCLGVLNYKTEFQSGEADFLNKFAPSFTGCVVDVGANEGGYSKRVRDLNPHVDIYSFEPHPVTYKRMLNNLQGRNIRAYNLAVGSSEGVLDLYDYALDDGSQHASLYKDVIEKLHHGLSVKHRVDIVKLDNFIKKNPNINHISLLKIDTEGHELEVLKGFEEFIKLNRIDYIHFEFNEMNIVSKSFFKDFMEFLPNYDFYRMVQNGLIPIKVYSPIFCEIFAYQNILAIHKK